MHTSQDGIDLIKQAKGSRLIAYQNDVDQWAIGYNHTDAVHPNMLITQEQAEAWLRDDLRPIEQLVDNLVIVPLKQHEFDALVAFTYDMGAETLRHSDLLAFLNAHQYERVPDAFLDFGNGVRDHRRLAERALFLSPPNHGVWGKLAKWLLG